VTLAGFVDARQGAWASLAELIAAARGKPERLGAARLLLLGRLYRQAAADLAQARRRYPGDPVTAHLESLVLASRHLVYEPAPRRQRLWEFVSTGYWRRVAERRTALAIAAALLFVPAVLAFVWAVRDPAHASAVVPGAYQAVSKPRPHGANLGLSADERTGLAAAIFTHNITVTFLAFALGIGAGILTSLLLAINGLQLGVVAGLASGAGHGRIFTELVVGHGVLELSCVCVAGAAGLRLGWALVAPGHRLRKVAVTEEARATTELVLGTAPWLVVAGLVEGYVTPAGWGLAPVAGLGIGLALAYWSLVVWRGRAVTPAPEPSP